MVHGNKGRTDKYPHLTIHKDAGLGMRTLMYARSEFDSMLSFEEGIPLQWQDVRKSYLLENNYDPKTEYKKEDNE